MDCCNKEENTQRKSENKVIQTQNRRWEQKANCTGPCCRSPVCQRR